MLHFIPDEDDPFGAVAVLRDALAPGSYLAVTHGAPEGFDDTVLANAVKLYERTPTSSGGLRDREQILRFFGDFELVPPGLVWLSQWRPEHPDDIDERFAARPQASAFMAAVGRKPA